MEEFGKKSVSSLLLHHSLRYATPCFAGPISASLRPGKTGPLEESCCTVLIWMASVSNPDLLRTFDQMTKTLFVIGNIEGHLSMKAYLECKYITLLPWKHRTLALIKSITLKFFSQIFKEALYPNFNCSKQHNKTMGQNDGNYLLLFFSYSVLKFKY